MLGLYSYDITCRGRKRHTKGWILAHDILNARFKISCKHSTRRLLRKHGFYDCEVKYLMYI